MTVSSWRSFAAALACVVFLLVVGLRTADNWLGAMIHADAISLPLLLLPLLPWLLSPVAGLFLLYRDHQSAAAGMFAGCLVPVVLIILYVVAMFIFRW